MRKSMKRMVTLLMAVMTMAICFSFSAVSAAAAEPVAAVAMVEMAADDSNDTMTIQAANMVTHKILPLTGAAGGAGSAGGSVSNTQADTTYKSVVNFFITWITRIGWLVAFVGAIMFALAIKNNDAEQKQSGLMTMIAGFVAAAVCMAADMFNLFS